MNILPESRTTEVKSLVWNVDQQVDKIMEEASSRHRHLEDVNKKWKTFDTLIESVCKWMEDAEALITNGTLKACKVRTLCNIVRNSEDLCIRLFSWKEAVRTAAVRTRNRRKATCFVLIACRLMTWVTLK